MLWAIIWGLTAFGCIIATILAIASCIGSSEVSEYEQDLSTAGTVWLILKTVTLPVAALVFFFLWLKANQKENMIAARLKQIREQEAKKPPSYNPPTAVREVSTQRVHFSIAARRETLKVEGYNYQSAMIGCGCFVIVITAVYFLWPLLALPSNVVLAGKNILYLAIAVGCVLQGIHAWRKNRRHRPLLASLPDESFRLRCIGAPEELEKYGELVDAAFEPAIFNVSWTKLAVFRPIVRRFMMYTGIFAGIAILTACSLVYRISSEVVLGSALVAPLLAYVASVLVWNTYIRIVPGQLEVLQYSVFGRKHTRSVIIKLRNARVLINLQSGYVHIEPPESDSQPFRFSTALIPGKGRLAYVILLAALSTHQPGPLTDNLTGD
ncbi:MAG: hypothetical protein ABIG44_18660, partial [Planctomycetota bacterium]